MTPTASPPAPDVLPTFLVIGAQKAGTTSLDAYLRQQPQVFMAREKELNFFCDPGYSRGIGWYEEQFAAASPAQARGEVSPFYTSYPWKPHVPERAARHVPDAKLVYLLRNPIERMLSNYRHHVALGVETRPIAKALFVDTWQYIDRSSYAMQLGRWLEFFDRSSVLVITSEELRADPPRVLARVFAHIGVAAEPPDRLQAQELNTGESFRRDGALAVRLKRSRVWPVVRAVAPARLRHSVWRVAASQPLPPEAHRPTLEPEVYQRLVERLRPDLEQLRSLLGGDFDCWGLLA